MIGHRKEKPPNGKGDAENVANPASTLGASLAFQLRKINHADSTGWRAHGEWLLNRFQRTGDPRHLKALRTHVAGIQERLTQ